MRHNVYVWGSMKKIILSAALAAFAFGVAPAMADTLPVTVVKTQIPEGCEYKRVPGKKKKELICIEEMTGGLGGGGAIVDAGGSTPQEPDPIPTRGNSGVQVGANNGKGNGDDGTTNPPGGSGKKFASGGTDGR